MDQRELFFESVINYLEMPTSGALMIAGAWGSGKTYYIDHTLWEKLKEKEYFPVKLSLFGLEKIDSIERLVAEEFLSNYGEENLVKKETAEEDSFERIQNLFKKMKGRKIGKKAESITESFPFLKQYVDVGRWLDAYYTSSFHRLPKEKLVVILDDLERAVETITPHLLLGAINNLVETKKYKVIVVANDSYFNKSAENYLEFKEKVIERTLLFPADVVSVYKELTHELAEKCGSGFEDLMRSPGFINVINPQAENNLTNAKLAENLKNIRIVKFALAHFAKVYEVLVDTIKEQSDDRDMKDFLVSLWALTVGLSIEYKCNRLTYQEREAYIQAASVDSFAINLGVDLGNDEPNPFASQTQHDEDEQKYLEEAIEKIRTIFKFYIERHSFPLIPSVQVFDMVTTGVSADKLFLVDRWKEYKQDVERKKEIPAISLLNKFLMTIGAFTNEEFPDKLKELADYTVQADFPDVMSYINVATFLQHYGILAGFDEKSITEIITSGIDKHFEQMVNVSPIVKSNLEVIASEIPQVSQWVLRYALKKLEEFTDRQQQNNIEEAISQFKDDLVSLAERLTPNPSSTSVPDFFTYPILAKIPEEDVVEKLKSITPMEVVALCSIIRSRFVAHNTMVEIEDEKVFLDNVKKGIEARGTSGSMLSDMVILDQLVPILNKF